MRDRVLTSVVLAPVVLAILFLSSPWPLAGLGLLVVTVCVLESSSLLSIRSRIRPVTYFGFPFAVYTIVYLPEREITAAVLACCALAGIGCVFLSASGRVRNFVVDDLASMWYAAPVAACVLLHGDVGSAGTWAFRSPLLMALLPVWAGDVAGIFAGRAFGKHLLAPTLSPKKTVEGAVANLVAAVLAGAVFGLLLGLKPIPSVACGVAAGLLGQLGDLFESYVKRRADKKDSGSILPGHGGVLDRIDSLLFSAPAVALILARFR